MGQNSSTEGVIPSQQARLKSSGKWALGKLLLTSLEKLISNKITETLVVLSIYCFLFICITLLGFMKHLRDQTQRYINLSAFCGKD